MRMWVAGTVGWAGLSLCGAAWAGGPAAGEAVAVERAMQSATTTQPTTTAEGVEGELLEAGEAGRAEMARARSLVEGKKYIEADALLRGLVEQFAGTEIAEAAEAEREALRGRPEAAAALQAADWQRDAAGMLARADALAREERYEAALEGYELVGRLYGQGRAGQEARQKADYLRLNKRIGERIRQQRAEREAVTWLSVARSYGRMGRVEEARRYYERLIRAEPETGYARTARQELEALVP